MEQAIGHSGEIHQGLCSGCEKQRVCTYPRQLHAPVLNCLEYEELSVAERPRREPAGASSRLNVTVGVSPEQREPGLCGICEQRDRCTYPRSPGGVWFCEEYQ
jgi:hypothetical protein